MKNKTLQEILVKFPDYLEIEFSKNPYYKDAKLSTFIAYNYGMGGKIPLNKESEKFVAKHKLETNFDNLILNKETGAIEAVVIPADEGGKDKHIPVKLRDEHGHLILAYVKIVII